MQRHAVSRLSLKLNPFSCNLLFREQIFTRRRPSRTFRQPIAPQNPPWNVSEDETAQFQRLLRNSNFINLGDPKSKIVLGQIFHTVANDLYIDFGWKFHCVCPRPSENGELYVRGSKVLLEIEELELSSCFLGSKRALTLLEADAHIIRLVSSPVKQKST